MHILLPPSEGKTSGGRGRPLLLDPAAGALPAARAEVIDALSTLVTGDHAKAAAALHLPPGLADDALAANAAVRSCRTTPALRRYSGVIYDGLSAAHLSPAAAKLASRSVHIFSGLLGVVRGDEPVPYYRVPAKAELPGIGIVGTYWKPILRDVLAARMARGLILDLRSSDYAAMWKPGRATAMRTVTVRVLSRTPTGKYAVISYNSKFAKGRLARALIEARAAGHVITTVEDVADAWEHIGVRSEHTAPTHLDLYTH